MTCTSNPNAPPRTDVPTVLIPIPASVVITIWYWPASLPSALLTVRLRQLSEKEYLEVLVQERLTAPPIPVNTHWIPSLVTVGAGSFTMVKEIVTDSPILIGLLFTSSEGDTIGGTAENKNMTTAHSSAQHNSIAACVGCRPAIGQMFLSCEGKPDPSHLLRL